MCVICRYGALVSESIQKVYSIKIMGTALFTMCLDSHPIPKPATALPPAVPNLQRLQVKARTLPVIMEEYSDTPDPSPSHRAQRKASSGRMEPRALVVRKRLKTGYRGNTTSAC